MVFYSTKRRGKCCKVPPLTKNSKTKFQRQYDQSFHVNGARLWNSIPKRVKQKKSFATFKAALTKLTLQLPDNPPIPGIASENSLIQLLARRAAGPDYTEDGGSETSDGDSEEPSDEDICRMARDR